MHPGGAADTINSYPRKAQGTQLCCVRRAPAAVFTRCTVINLGLGPERIGFNLIELKLLLLFMLLSHIFGKSTSPAGRPHFQQRVESISKFSSKLNQGPSSGSLLSFLESMITRRPLNQLIRTTI